MTDEGAPKTRSHGRIAISASLKPRELMADAARIKGAWTARIITLFPETFPGTLGLSLTGKALAEGLWALETIDLRPFGDRPAPQRRRQPGRRRRGHGAARRRGGRGPDRAAIGTPADRARWPVLYLSPRGKPLHQDMARALAPGRGVTLLCGRFEGVDQRVLDHFAVRRGQPRRFRPDRRRDRRTGLD